MLCSSCQNFNIQAFGRDKYEYRGYRLTAVVRAAQAGCSFCSLLLDHLKRADIGDRYSRFTRYLTVTASNETAVTYIRSLSMRQRIDLLSTWLIGKFMLTTWVHLSVERGISENVDCLDITHIKAFVGSWTGMAHKRAAVKINVAADEGTPASISRDVTGRLKVEQILALDVFENIKEWHNRCSRDHPRCSSTLSGRQSFDVDKVPLPSRCIEILSSRARDQTPCRWALRETAAQEGRYIILSHRWDAETVRAKTTRENYGSRLALDQNVGEDEVGAPGTAAGSSTAADTPYNRLPQLFNDTCVLAARLGIKYVWIDSICIVQDDPDDWKTESVKMAHYYQYAWLTVAATTQSLFRTREVAEIPRVGRLPYYDQTGEQQGHFYVQSCESGLLEKDFTAGVSDNHLLRRGWVYQEWMLSRRLLSFSNRNIFLQCSIGPPESAGGDVIHFARDEEQRNTYDFSVKSTTSTLTGMVAYQDWKHIVSTYSGLQLTEFVEDRIVALAGIANEFGQMVKNAPYFATETIRNARLADRYACGLWLCDICTSLLWEQSQSGRRSRVECIPTWSWASIASYDMGVDVTSGGSDRKLTGMTVQWSDPVSQRRFKRGWRCLIEDAVTVPIDYQKWEPDFSRASYEAPATPEQEYGDYSRFVLLRLRGRLFPVRLAACFGCERDVTIAATMSGLRVPDGNKRSLWRRVWLSSQPNTVVGRASIEDPDFQTDEACVAADGVAAKGVFAFVVKKFILKGFGLGFGNFGGKHTAFDVLFVRRVDVEGFNPAYERIGVGNLFGNEVEALYESAENGMVWLA